MKKKKKPRRNKNRKKCNNANHQNKISIVERKNTIYHRIINIICKQKNHVHLLIATLAVIIGFIFDAIDNMPLYWLKGLFGFSLYLFLCHTIKYIEQKNDKLKIELTGDPALFKCQMNYLQKNYSNLNIFLCVFACIYFSCISIVLGFVKINPIGVYSLFALDIVVFLAFIIFQQYIHIMLLLNHISKIKAGKFYELIPEKTEWFALLEEYSSGCRNKFIILGSLFILLFIIFSPVNSIQIIFYDRFSSNQFIPLLCTWIIILLAIIIMIPFSSYVRNWFLHKIYDNLISQSIYNYKQLYEKSNVANKITYLDIMLRLYDRKYTLKTSYAWVVPVLASVTNFSSVIISTVADLKSIGLLN
ncbi:MAG: hypothetical protein NC240_05430 [Clostridium sp.]|nr:hypothetical protein [Clostridium sp.]